MREAMRLLGIAVAVGAVAGLLLGVGLGLAQEESVPRWIAYMLSIAGAVTIGFACFSGAPTSARKHVARRMQATEEPDVPGAAEGAPIVSELVVLFTAGLLLITAGTALELVV